MLTISADVGGAFTDLVLIDAEGDAVHRDDMPGVASGAFACVGAREFSMDPANEAGATIVVGVMGLGFCRLDGLPLVPPWRGTA